MPPEPVAPQYARAGNDFYKIDTETGSLTKITDAGVTEALQAKGLTEIPASQIAGERAIAAEAVRLGELTTQDIAATEARIAALPKGNETIVSAGSAAESSVVRGAANQGFPREGFLEVDGQYSKYSVSPSGRIDTSPITDPQAIAMLSEGQGFTRTTASAVAQDVVEARAAADAAASTGNAKVVDLAAQEKVAAAARDAQLVKLLDQEIADTQAKIAALPKGNETIVSARDAADSASVRNAARQGFSSEGYLEVNGRYSKYSVSPNGNISTTPITDPVAIKMLSEGEGFTRTTASAVARDAAEARAAANIAANAEAAEARLANLLDQERAAAAAQDTRLAKLIEQEIADTRAQNTRFADAMNRDLANAQAKSNATTQARAAEFDALARYDGPIVSASNLAELQKALNGNVARSPGGSGGGLSVTNPSGSGAARGTPVGTAPTGVSPVSVLEKTISDFKILPLPPVSEIPTIVAQDIRSGIGNVTRTVEDAVVAVRNGTADVFDKLGLAKAGDAIRVPSSAGVKVTESPALAKNQLIQQVSNPALSSTLPQWLQSNAYGIGRGSNFYDGKDVAGAPVTTERTTTGGLTQEFNDWLNGSIFVDKKGNPITLYHVSAQPISAFDINNSNEIGLHVGTVDTVLTVADKPMLSPKNNSTISPTTYSFVLNVKNPLRIPDLTAFLLDTPRFQNAVVTAIARDQILAGRTEYAAENGKVVSALRQEVNNVQQPSDVRKILKSYGYDAIIYANTLESGGKKVQFNSTTGKYVEIPDDGQYADSLILLDPARQVRSAITGNYIWDPSTGIALDQSAPATEPAVPADVNVPLAWLPFATVPNLARAVVLATMSFNPVVGNLVGAILPASSEPIQVAPAVPSSVSQVANSTVPLSVEEIAEAKTAIEDISTRIGNPKYGEIDARDFVAEVEKESTLYLPGSPKTRALVDTYINPEPQRMNEYYFTASDYAALEKLYGNPRAFAQTFFAQRPKLFIERVLGYDGLAGNNFSATDISKDYAWLVPSVANAVIADMPEYLLSGLGASQSVMPTILRYVMPYVDTATGARMVGAIHARIETADIHSLFRMPDSVISFAYGNAQSPQTVRVQLIRQALKSGTFDERLSKALDLEQELSNAVSAKTPEKAMLSYYDALSMEYMNTSLDVVMSLPTSHRLQQFLVDMLDFATRPEPRSVFDDDFRRQTINNDLQRARQTAPSPIAAYPTAETIMRGLFGLDRFLQTRNYPGTADLFVTAYVNNAARADLAGSAISLLDTDTVRILNGYSSPTSYAVRTELLDTTSIKNAIAKYTPAQQRRSFSLIEQLVPDKAYLVQKLRELVVGNSNPNAVAMLTSYAELFMSNREELMAASKLTSLIEDGFRNDVWQMRVSGARTDDLIQTNSIDEDIRKAFADNQLTKPVIALINAGQIAPYDFAIARRGDLADLLHTGGEYILQYMADALPVWQTDSQNLVSLRKTADYLLNAKYPLIEIRSLLMQGFPKDAAQAWEKFGRVYPTDRSPGVSRDWENVPLAKTFHLTSDYLFNRNSYATLQPFEIAQADAYARLFRFLENSGRTDLETEMITNLNLSKFDVDAGNRIAAGEVPQLFKEIRTMGNTVTPQMQRTLGERVMQNHSAELAAYFEKNGIIKPDGTMRVTVPQLGAVAAYMDILQIQRSVRNLYDRLDNTISFIDPTSIDVSSISPASITSLDDFLKVYGTLNSIRDAFGLNGRTVRFDDTGGMKTAKTALDALVQELSDRAPQVFASAQTGTSIPDPSTIEPFRADLNRTTRGAGDDVLKKVAESFIDNAKDIDALLEFGRSWSAFGDKRGGDIAELYKLPAGFAFNQAYSLLLAKPELLTPARATIFDQNGFSTAPNQGLVGKAISRIASGKAVTTGQRIVSRVLGTTPETAVGTVAKMPYEKPLRDHATAEYLCVGDCSANTAEALLVTVDAEKGAARLEASKSGMVDTDTIAKQMSGSLVFHAPVSFTTGARRVMDVAFKSGVAVGSFVKTDGRDGIIVANAAGKVVVVNKRNLRLGDLTKVGVPVAPEDMDVRIDITRSLGEYRRFFDLMQTNKLSGLTNMLLAENGVPSPTAILDANDSRRMFVVMSDGSIGVVSSLKNMPTNRLLSLALAAGAHDVIYMDTGMYDMASLTDKNGGNRVLGHKDSQDSTNRLFLYVPDTTPGSLSVPIEVPTTQVTNIQPQGKTVASIFGTPTDKLKGNNTMASGQKIDYTQNKGLFVVAHKTLPFGTEVLIRNPANGKTVVAQVGERGSYVAGRELDLFETVAKELGFGIGDKGVIAVEWAVIPNSAKGVTPYKAGRTDLGDLSKNGPLGITAGLSDASTKYAAVFAPNKAVAANTVSAPPVAVPPSRPAPARVAATVRPPVVTTTLEEPFTLAAYKITPAAPSKTVVELRDKVSGIANQI
ncbi:hypothetical protein EXS56_02925, partial [Candidatus Kaiserbacteria bacterium]|nr:hypothetical protein [Candidatus Kaiserbacteria bacterium]